MFYHLKNLLQPGIRIKVIVALTVFPVVAPAQIEWGGIFDFEFRKGEDASSLQRNNFINNNPHFLAHRLQMFLDAYLEEHISFTAKIQNSVIFPDRLKELEVQLAYLTISEIGGADINVSAGRILTPFGLFAKRQLSPDNPFIGTPLYFQYQLKVSPSLGYRPEIPPRDPYGGLSTMYLGGYYTGVELFGSFADRFIEYDLAVMNAPLSIFNSDYNTTRSLSYQGRVEISPFMFLSIGVSGNHGRFMDRDVGGFREIVADSVLEELDRFTQVAWGIDLTFDWLHYQIIAEYVDNVWNAPFIRTDTYPYSSGIPRKSELKLVNREFVLDAKIDVPFLIGLYVASRLNILTLADIDNPLEPGTKIAWDHPVRRYAVGVGYKISRRVLLKANYEWTLVETDPRPNLNTWGLQLSARF